MIEFYTIKRQTARGRSEKNRRRRKQNESEEREEVHHSALDDRAASGGLRCHRNQSMLRTRHLAEIRSAVFINTRTLSERMD